MAEKIGLEAVFDIREFNNGLRVYQTGLLRAQTETQQAADGISRSGSLIAAGLGAALGTAAINQIEGVISALGRLGEKALDVVIQFERIGFSLQAAFSIELVNEGQFDNVTEALSAADEVAQGYLLTLQDIAIFSPSTTLPIAEAFRMLTAYGFLREEALAITEQIVDWGSAWGKSDDQMQRVAYALGQIRAEGRLLARDALQLTSAGVLVYDALIKKTGLTVQELNKIQRESGLSAEVALQALNEWFLQFEGAGKRVSGTVYGLISSLKDIEDIVLRDVFKGVFEPLIPILQQMVDIFSSSEFRAGVAVFGELIGARLSTLVNMAVDSIKNFIGTITSLPPEVYQAALAFAAAVVAMSAFAAAVGIAYIAVQLLINPFTLVTAAVATFAAAYVTNFAGVADATNSLVRILGNVTSSVSSIVSRISNLFFGMADDVISSFSSIADAASDWGYQIAANLAAGMEAAVSIVIAAVSVIGSAISFLMSPGSPPRFLPYIDVWGRETAEVYLLGWTDADFSILNEVGTTIRDILSDMFDAENLPRLDFEAIVSGSNKAFANAIAELHNFGEITVSTLEQIRQAGGPAGNALVELALRYERITQAANNAAMSLQANHEQFIAQIRTFSMDDIRVFGQIESAITSMVQSLSSLGEIDAIDVPSLLVGNRQLLVNIISDIKLLGSVTDSVMSQVETLTGRSGEALKEFITIYTQLSPVSQNLAGAQDNLAEAQARVREEQEKLNKVVAHYDELLNPLKDKLTAVNEESLRSQEDREIRQLQRIIASNATSNLQKEEARLKIQETLAAREVRALETQRDAALEGAEESVTVAQEQENLFQQQVAQLQEAATELQGQLTLLTDRLGLEASTLDIYKQQSDALRAHQEAIEAIFATQTELVNGIEKDYANAIDKLQKKLEKEAKKLLEPLERALKLQQLMSQELQSLLTIAKARHTLASDETTEYEKQVAALTLQEELVKRMAREKEFIELGGSLEDLQRLRDVNIVLEDIIGKIKAKKGKDDGDLFGDMSDSIALLAKHNPEDTLREFNEAMERMRGRFSAIGEDIGASLEALDNALPSFLKFRTEAGETSPIITTLGSAFAGLVASFASSKIIGILKGFGGIFLGTASKTNVLVGAISLLAAAWTGNWLNIRERTSGAIGQINQAIDAFQIGMKGREDTFSRIGGGIRLALASILPPAWREAWSGAIDSIDTFLKSLDSLVAKSIENGESIGRSLLGIGSLVSNFLGEFFTVLPLLVSQIQDFDLPGKLSKLWEDSWNPFIVIGISSALRINEILGIILQYYRLWSTQISKAGADILKGVRLTTKIFSNMTADILSELRLAASNIGNALRGMFSFIVPIITGVAHTIQSEISKVAKVIFNPILGAIGRIRSIVTTGLTSFFSGLWTVILRGIASVILLGISAIGNLINFRGLAGIIAKASSFLVSGAQTVINAVLGLNSKFVSVISAGITLLSRLNVGFVSRVESAISSVLPILANVNVRLVSAVESAIQIALAANARFVNAMLNISTKTIIQAILNLNSKFVSAVSSGLSILSSLNVKVISMIESAIQVALSANARLVNAISGAGAHISTLIRRFGSLSKLNLGKLLGSIGSGLVLIASNIGKAFKSNLATSFFTAIHSLGIRAFAALQGLSTSMRGVVTAANQIKITSAIQKFVNFLLGPFRASATGVGKAFGGLFNLFKNFKLTNVLASFGRMFSTIKNISSAFGGLLNPINLLIAAVDFFAFAWNRDLDGAGGDAATLGDRIREFWADLISGEIWRKIVEAVAPWMARLGEVWQDVQENGFDSTVLQTFLSDLGTTIVEKLKEIGSNIWTNIVEFWAPAFWEWIVFTVEEMGKQLGAMLTFLWDWIVKGATWIKESFVNQWIPAFTGWWEENDVTQKIIKFLTDMLVKVQTWITQGRIALRDKFKDEWIPAMEDWVENSLPGLVTKLSKWLVAILLWLGEKSSVVIEKLLEWGTAFIEWLGPVAEQTIIKLGEWLGGILEWIIGTGIPAVIKGTFALIGALIGWIAGGEGNDDTATGRIPEALGTFLTSIVNFFKDHILPALVDAGKSIGQGVWDGFTKLWDELDLSGLLDIAKAKTVEIGKAMVDGLKDGFEAKKKEISDRFTAMIDALIKDVENLLRIDSPSLLMSEKVGAPMADGLIQGLTGKLSERQSEATTAVSSLVNSLSIGPVTEESAKQGSAIGTNMLTAFSNVLVKGEEAAKSEVAGFTSRVSSATSASAGTTVLEALRTAIDAVKVAAQFIELGITIAGAIRQGLYSVSPVVSEWASEEVTNTLDLISAGISTFAEAGKGLFDGFRRSITSELFNLKIQSLIHTKSMSGDILEIFELLYTDVEDATSTYVDDIVALYEDLRTDLNTAVSVTRTQLNILWGLLKTDTVTTATDMKDDVVSAYDTLKLEIEAKFATIKQAISDRIDEARAASLASIEKMSEQILAEIDSLLKLLTDQNMLDRWDSAGEQMGLVLMNAIKKAMKDSIKGVSDTAAAAVTAAIAAAKAAAEASSPSKRMAREVGDPLVQGLLEPLRDAQRTVGLAGKALVESMFSGATLQIDAQLSPLSSALTPRSSFVPSALQPASSQNIYSSPVTNITNNYNLGVYTSESQEVVQRSFAVMETLAT